MSEKKQERKKATGVAAVFRKFRKSATGWAEPLIPHAHGDEIDMNKTTRSRRFIWLKNGKRIPKPCDQTRASQDRPGPR
jgi:hypothetical protein